MEPSFNTFSESLGILREHMKILFKSPQRKNIFLQVVVPVFFGIYSPLKVREHDLPQDCDPEPFLAFVPPILAASARISMQIFFQSKFLLNRASAYFSSGM